MKSITSILFATDFSPESEYAFDYALTMAKRFDAQLLAIHVINEPLDLRGFYVPHISFDNLEEEIRSGAEKHINDFCNKHTATFKKLSSRIATGIPHEVIISTGLEINADIIVLGTHGRSGLDHVLFGSTAEKVVRKSPIPVLTIRIGE